MDSSIYISTASQRALGRQLEIIANNIANASTIGFKSENADFTSVVSKTKSNNTHFPNVTELSANMSEGARIETGNSLDVAISGAAWLGIMTPAGIAYTRDGRFTLSPVGELLNIHGDPVVDSAGAPLNLGDISGADVTITKDSRILVNDKFVADLGLFSIDPSDISKRYGTIAFMTSQIPQPAIPGQDASVHQGFVENSNTNSMKEMANLITISRMFEASSTAIEKADQAITRASQELAQRR